MFPTIYVIFTFQGACIDEGKSLFNAAKDGILTEVKTLLGNYPEIDINCVKNDKTPLYVASKSGYSDVVKELVKRPQTDVNKGKTDERITPLYAASEKGHLDTVQILLAHENVEVNIAKLTWGATPLHAASKKGKVDVVRELLCDERVDPNIQNSDGRTPLMSATFNSKINVVEVLLASPRVDTSVNDNAGNTALDLAEKNGQLAEASAIESRSTFLQDGFTCPQELGEYVKNKNK